jgi:hypothetical protein
VTVPTGEYIGDQDEWEADDMEIPPVRVLLAGTNQRQNAPDFGGATLFSLPVAGTSLPVQILQRRPTREQAYVRNTDPANSILFAERPDKVQAGIGFILGPGLTQKIESQQPYYGVSVPAAASSAASLAATGSAAIVAGGQTVVSETLPAGTYVVNWNMLLSAAATTADVDNAQLMIGATVIMVANYGDTLNTTYPQLPVTVVIPAGGAVLSVQSIGAGSATSTYRSSIVATPVGSAPGSAPVTVAVLDEAWIVINEPTRQEYEKGIG